MGGGGGGARGGGGGQLGNTWSCDSTHPPPFSLNERRATKERERDRGERGIDGKGKDGESERQTEGEMETLRDGET